MAQVRLEQVTKIYPGNVKAVDAIDLEVRDQEFLVLVGPSGCGKSTTLRMVAGLEVITEGKIWIGDRIVNEVIPKNRDIAMVFQNYALYPHMSVYKNMGFGLKLRKFPKEEIDRRVREAARILGIEELLDRRPKNLSGGQRQRVAVGRAIVRDPAAFLFDEPLSNLDAKLRVEMRAELKRLHKRLQTTTIYVTHDQEEAMTLADRVVVMSEGLIQQADPPLRVYRAPRNQYVAGFLGSPPMNFVSGQLRKLDDGNVAFEGEGWTIPLTKQQQEAVIHRVGEDVVLGIRPEAFALRPFQDERGDDARAVKAHVDVVEPLGNEMDAYIHTPSGNTRLVTRLKAEPLGESDGITLYADMTMVHVFEPGTYGENLTHSVDEQREGFILPGAASA
ncbi:MAG: ABC transporter ATP-binding protein [Phycisphaeraceae bacterium]